MQFSAVPVEFGPHEADWWMVGVSALAAVASLVLALFAWLTSREAKGQAKASERARREEQIQAQTRRDFELEDKRRFEYELRLDDAVADMFQSIAAYLDLVPEYLERCEEVEIRGRTDHEGNLLYPPKPSTRSVRTSFEIVRLRAKDDADTFQSLARYLELILGRHPFQHANMLGDLVEYLREYRSGITRDQDLLDKVSNLMSS